MADGSKARLKERAFSVPWATSCTGTSASRPATSVTLLTRTVAASEDAPSRRKAAKVAARRRPATLERGDLSPLFAGDLSPSEVVQAAGLRECRQPFRLAE